jgi:ribonuclease P protein component
MERLRRRADFRAASSGMRTSAGGFVLQARPRDDQGGIRVGFTVSRQVGNAVERNRVRRRLREIARLAAKRLAAKRLAGNKLAGNVKASEGMRQGHDYVLIGRRAALTLPFAEMQRQFGTALRRVHTTEYGRDTAGGRRDRHLHQTGPSRPKPRDA